ncbi:MULTISPECIES: sodium:solute symporter [Cellulophaga]|uniref:SSS sodium solute transporter superfamily n=2 Tax=Cellulophaga TaxID=104264 RepID=F0RG88_CELLC|nr:MULTISPECIES: sodium:solute symporter [Cellulophaga]ADY29054.1 SSS sodium solute transporter superfamily [Cellulophaga lytica DSM 7489]AIM60096.1 sodium transporter [Cellulophaga lytica]EWH13190.1 sodium solute transporter superfamily protein [Cellulophaga geojensis KL-A]MDO6854153.1 sodium:solute symporter [Cellulophaga lytica]TVZ08380.1 SSS family solute:Na+ symporter [Cellulophaga sp. RHA_52]
MSNLSYIDLTVLVLYIVFIVWWALKNGKSKDSDAYFLAGRNLTWPMVGLSLFAASVSSSTLMGHSGEGFISGIAVFNYNWISVLIMVFFAMFFLPFYIKSGIFTMPEFLERRFDGKSRSYFSFITIIGNVFLDASATLYTGALIIKMIFPEVEIFWIIIGMAAVAGSYTIIGGLSSAINADMIQAAVLIIGSSILSFYAISSIGGWESFIDKFNDGVWLKLTRPLDDPTVPWLGMWIGIPILGFYFWANNQVMVQRVLSAKSIDHGRKGVLLVGFLYLFTLFIFIVPGLIARGINLFGVENLPHELISGIDLKEKYGINTDQVYPRLIVKLLPVGLIGIILSAMISALTSTLSATLSSVSTLFTMDFYSKIDKNASSAKKVKVGKITAVVTLVIAVIWAPYIQTFDSLIAYYQEIVSYLAPPIVGTFFIGLFWKRANAKGAFSGLMAGLAVAALIMTLKYVLNVEINIHFLLLAPVLLIISLVVSIIVSLATAPPPADKVAENTWTKQIWIDETKELKGIVWYKNFRVQAILLVIACFVMYGLFY